MATYAAGYADATADFLVSFPDLLAMAAGRLPIPADLPVARRRVVEMMVQEFGERTLGADV